MRERQQKARRRGNEERTLDDEIRSQDTHCGDTDTCFRGTVGSTEACEYDGARAAHRSEERLSHIISVKLISLLRDISGSFILDNSQDVSQAD